MMRGWAAGAAVLALLALPLLLAPAAHAADRGLAGEFMCQCGCGLTLASCTHAVCGPRDQMLGEIGRLQAAGRTPAQIRAAFIAAYGEGVLSAPLRRGFNLVAWWGPYAALAAGAGVVAALGAAWTRRATPVRRAPASMLSEQQRAMLQHELDRFKD